jgi:hypothetical protein
MERRVSTFQCTLSPGIFLLVLCCYWMFILWRFKASGLGFIRKLVMVNKPPTLIYSR